MYVDVTLMLASLICVCIGIYYIVHSHHLLVGSAKIFMSSPWATVVQYPNLITARKGTCQPSFATEISCRVLQLL
jgi:hypothetical protein